MRQTDEPFQMRELLTWLDMDGQMRNTTLTREIAAILRGLGYIPSRKRFGGSDAPRKCWIKKGA